MSAIQLRLPAELAEASADAAHVLGVSRSEWIRQAIEHELSRYRALREKHAMAASLHAMRTDAQALADADALDRGFSDTLAAEEGTWWKA